MNKKRNIAAFLLSVGAAVFILLPVSGFASLTDLEKCENERTALQIELQRYKAIEAEMKATIAKTEAEAVKQKAEFDAKSAEVDKAVANKQAELDKVNKENEALKKDKETSQQAVKAANDKVAQSAKAAADQKNADAQRIRELQASVTALKKELEKEQQTCAARVKELEDKLNEQKDMSVESYAKGDAEKEGLGTKIDSDKTAMDSSSASSSSSSQDDKDKIAFLEGTVADLSSELDNCKEEVSRQRERIERLAAQREELKKQLKTEIQNGDVDMPPVKGRIVINIHDHISFDAGSADLKKTVMPALNKIAKVLENYPEHKIIIEGHTDSDPIVRSTFASNQELSETRANVVLKYLLKNTNLETSRVSSVGRGDTRPIAKNDTPSNKALNRRVDIIVIPAVDDAEASIERDSNASDLDVPR